MTWSLFLLTALGLEPLLRGASLHVHHGDVIPLTFAVDNGTLRGMDKLCG